MTDQPFRLTKAERRLIQQAADKWSRKAGEEAWPAMRKLLWNYGHIQHAWPTLERHRLSRVGIDDVESNGLGTWQYKMGQEYLRPNGEPADHDSTLGPATARLFTLERCGLPDFAMETGRGSWDVGCHRDFPDIHTFTVNVDKSRMPSFLGRRDDPQSIFEMAFDLCRAAYADIGILFLREDGNINAQTTVTWERGNGWIGLAVVPNDPGCRDRIWARFDTRYNPQSPQILLLQWEALLRHEFGHNMGMGHFQGGVMNASILRFTNQAPTWRGDPAEQTLVRYFGGEPVPIPGEDPPDSDGMFEKWTETRMLRNGRLHVVKHSVQL